MTDKVNQTETQLMVTSKEYSLVKEEKERFELELENYRSQAANAAQDKDQVIRSLEEKMKGLMQQVTEDDLKNKVEKDML